jgi:hypothetical protein
MYMYMYVENAWGWGGVGWGGVGGRDFYTHEDSASLKCQVYTEMKYSNISISDFALLKNQQPRGSDMTTICPVLLSIMEIWSRTLHTRTNRNWWSYTLGNGSIYYKTINMKITYFKSLQEGSPSGRKQITEAADLSADKHVTVGHAMPWLP